MTEQEAFTKIVLGLRKQGRKSEGPANDGDYCSESLCMLRGDDGTKCAVGILIDDGDYTPDMEEVTLAVLHAQDSTPAGLPFTFLACMQEIHDSCDVDQWERKWEAYARDNDLEMQS